MKIDPQRLPAIHAQMQAGDVAGAVQAIAAVVAAEPANGPAWHLAGVVRRRAGDHAGAIEAFDRAVKAGVRSAELLNSLALSHEDLGEIPAAEAAIAEAIACDPAYIPAQVNAARLAHAQGRTREAEAKLQAVLAKNPRSVLASNQLASLLMDQGEPAAAAAQYRRSLSAAPGNLTAALRLGLALRESGQSDAALAHLKAHVGQFGSSPEFIDALCGALIECGAIAEAEATLERLVQQAPGYFPAHRALARLAREYRTGKDPYRSFRAMLAQWPGERVIWQNWFALMLSYRDHAKVLAAAAEARARLGALAEIDFYEAVARSEGGEGDEAEALFARSASQFGAYGPFLGARARNALRRGTPQQAEALAQQATALDPADQFAWAYLGLAWRVLGDPRELWLHDYAVQAQQRPVPYLDEPGALEELRVTLRQLHRAGSHPPDQSLRGGTQTEGALFNRSDPVVRRLRDAIRTEVEAYVARMPQDDAHPHYRRRASGVRFTGSWSVRLTGEGFHIAHIHQAGWISSALHITVPPPDLADGPHAGALVLGEPPSELGLDLPPRRIVQPVEGALVLFPSSMWHGTVAFKGGHERLTAAFDAVPA